ncbi:MAG: AAA family ATPase, partial [Zoogloeaceae bacterium]|nr:AAA family ATPase [Zoogloeaceae bacterium]
MSKKSVYTADDNAVIEHLNQWRVAHGVSQAALGRMARLSGATVSQVLGGSYPSSPAVLLKTLLQAVDAFSTQPDADAKPVESTVFRRGLALFRRARAERGFTVFAGNVGVGKTVAIRAYAAATANTFVIDATPLMTLQILIKKLARLVLGEVKGSTAQLYDDVVARLSGSDSFIIIDEAETLNDKQLHMIRRISDIAGIGVALVGTQHLRAMIGRESGQFDQIRSRTGFWPAAVSGITAEDAAMFVAAAFPGETVAADVVKRLYAYSRGSARMLGKQLLPAVREARGERALDVALVDAVAVSGLGLQKQGSEVRDQGSTAGTGS